MSDFTIKPLSHPTLVTLGEDMEGQVDIVVTDPTDGRDYRMAAIGDGKLHLFTMDTVIAKNIGLQLDANRYPIIVRV